MLRYASDSLVHRSADSPPRSRPVQLNCRRLCPHCGSGQVHGHGFFVRKDGSREHRHLCRTCGRTSNQHTETPLHYIKKRDRWARLGQAMALKLTVRGTASSLKVAVATAFRWRHRLLAALSNQPHPVLTGTVAASEAFVPYSAKGSRRPPSVRRFIDRKPACVLLACGGAQQVTVIISRGRPTSVELQAALKRLLGPGVELYARGFSPFAQACESMCVPHRDSHAGPDHHLPYREVDRLRGRLFGWLLHFRGVATRYLHHYLVWLRFNCLTARLDALAAGHTLLSVTNTLRMPRSAA